MTTNPWKYTDPTDPIALPGTTEGARPFDQKFDGDWMNPNQPDPLTIGEPVPDEPAIITRAQLEDLRGLVSDIQTIAAQLEAQCNFETVKFLDSPLTATNWEAFGKVQGYATAIELLRWALRVHPSSTKSVSSVD